LENSNNAFLTAFVPDPFATTLEDDFLVRFFGLGPFCSVDLNTKQP
jgi:hypothetical protein